jgi:hypothetical protein
LPKLFPAKAYVRFKENFSKPYAWDLGKRFRRICKLAGISELRIHDLITLRNHDAVYRGIPDAIIRKMTGYRSAALERYKHLSPAFQQQTSGLIAGKLTEGLGTKLGTTLDESAAPLLLPS